MKLRLLGSISLAPARLAASESPPAEARFLRLTKSPSTPKVTARSGDRSNTRERDSQALLLLLRAQFGDERGVIAREDGFLTKDARILANARLIDGRKRGVGRTQHVERTGEPNRAFESLAKARFVSRVSLQNLDEHLAPCLRSLELDKQSPDANTLFECCR